MATFNHYTTPPPPPTPTQQKNPTKYHIPILKTNARTQKINKKKKKKKRLYICYPHASAKPKTTKKIWKLDT